MTGVRFAQVIEDGLEGQIESGSEEGGADDGCDPVDTE